MLAVGDQIPDATVWFAPQERVSVRDVVEDRPALFLFYLFDWTSTSWSLPRKSSKGSPGKARLQRLPAPPQRRAHEPRPALADAARLDLPAASTGGPVRRARPRQRPRRDPLPGSRRRRAQRRP